MEITIWLTYMCNLACTYCYEGNIKRTQSMSMETADRVMEFITYKINSLEKKEKINIVLYGGEPLLNFHVFTLFAHKIGNIKEAISFCRNCNISYDKCDSINKNKYGNSFSNS